MKVRRGERLVVFVGRRGLLAVEVRTREGTAVADARVLWESLSDIAAWDDRPDGMPEALLPSELDEGVACGVTDATGRVELRVPSGFAKVHVFAPGFEPFQTEVEGPLARPVVVVLTPGQHAKPATVQVLDGRGGGPVSDARIWSDLGESRTTDGNGTARLPLSFLDRRLVCRKAGFVPLAFVVPLESTEKEVRLQRSATLEIRTESAGAGPCSGALARFEMETDWEDAGGGVAWPRFATLDGMGRASLDFPLGAEGIVRVAAEDGSSGEARFVLREEQTRVTVPLRIADPLELEIVDESGSPIEEGRVALNYGGGRGYVPDAETVLAIRGSAPVRIARPEDLDRIEVWAPGHAPVHFAPRAKHEYARVRCEASLSGRLRVSLPPGLPLHVFVEDDQGRPRPGVRVLARVGRGEIEANSNAHRTLLGALPTEHPGWVRLVRLSREAITDGRGEVWFEDLEPGRYKLAASLPLEKDRGDTVADLVRWTSREVVLPRRGAAVLNFPSVRRVTLRATDGATGQAVPRFEIHSDIYRDAVEVPGGFWDGWVACTDSSLTITADGYGAVDVPLAVGEEDIFQEVPLWKEQGVHLDLRGDLEGLEGATLIFDLWSSPDAEGMRFHQGGGEFEFTGSEGMDLDLSGPCDVSIRDVEIEGVRWSFAPRFLEWSPGRALTFAARRDSAPGRVR
ncbi:MAG TPA: hypothetical protein ENJ09_02830 [Planctomycetes bacterium]|nr:hypothetical protein [Planctomycetota bacterium]